MLKLGLALQIGFLRVSGRPLEAFRIVPANLWRYLGAQFAVEAPDIASLRAMYRQGNTLFEQQQLACQALGFQSMSERQRRPGGAKLSASTDIPPRQSTVPSFKVGATILITVSTVVMTFNSNNLPQAVIRSTSASTASRSSQEQFATTSRGIYYIYGASGLRVGRSRAGAYCDG